MGWFKRSKRKECWSKSLKIHINKTKTYKPTNTQ